MSCLQWVGPKSFGERLPFREAALTAGISGKATRLSAIAGDIDRLGPPAKEDEKI
jgi:hypothetical protein